jgi:hypothetical protein
MLSLCKVAIIDIHVAFLLLFLSLLNRYVSRRPPNVSGCGFPQTYAAIISSRR